MFSPAEATAMPFCSAFRKRGFVGDDVVGGEDAQHRVGIFAFDQEGGQAAGGRGVARHRLLNNLILGHILQLVGDLVGQILVGDNPGLLRSGDRLEALDGLLNHGTLAVQGQNLLGVGAARAGPEARAAASGEDYRAKIDWIRHRRDILTDKRYVCTEENKSILEDRPGVGTREGIRGK